MFGWLKGRARPATPAPGTLPNRLDLSAPIVPGESAAGFRLGERLEDLLRASPFVTRWDGPWVDFLAAAARSPHWLFRRKQPDSPQGPALVSPTGAVLLALEDDGRLREIVLGRGYLGLLAGRIRPGTRFTDLKAAMPVEYDRHEELFLPEGEWLHRGIGFLADDNGPNTPSHVGAVLVFEPV